MSKARFSIHVALALLLFLSLSATAQAQATRTWVSGVGDDANPCSRTAPCKTFAGAISKTATGGEINVLDPGGFGGVTITKAISIINDGVGSAGVLVSGTNAIIVNAPATAVVILRGLDIEGLGTGLNGIRYLAGGALHVENCTINNFAQKGIDVQTTGTVQLFVSDTIIRNNINNPNGGGIIVRPTSGTVKGFLENVQLRNNRFGLRVEANANVTAKNTHAVNSTNAGFVASTTTAAAVLFLDSCVSANNGTQAVSADGANAVARITNCSFTGSGGPAFATAGGAQILSFGTNSQDGNTGGSAPTGPVPQQ